MSTILKALKRAEQDCLDSTNKNKSSLKFNIRTTLNSRMKRQRGGFRIIPKQLVFITGLMIVAAVGSYFLFFDNKNFQSKLSSIKTVSQSPVTTSAAQNDKKTPTHQPTAESLVLQNAGQEDNTDAEIISDLKKVEVIPAFETKNPDSLKKSPSTPLQPISRLDTKKTDIDDTPVIPDIPPLDDGILKLQAISWSKDPTARVVIINSKILGEGDSVQGYSLLHIEKDEVVLRHSGREFKLGFKYR